MTYNDLLRMSRVLCTMQLSVWVYVCMRNVPELSQVMCCQRLCIGTFLHGMRTKLKISSFSKIGKVGIAGNCNSNVHNKSKKE